MAVDGDLEWIPLVDTDTVLPGPKRPNRSDMEVLFMKKLLVACALTLLFSSVPALAQDNGRGGGGSAECKYCKYNIWGGNYTCPTSAWGGRKGECNITWHMGQYMCKEPEGAACFRGDPIPTPPPVIQ